MNWPFSKPKPTVDLAGQVDAASATVAEHAGKLADSVDALRSLFRQLDDMPADEFNGFDGLMMKLAADSRAIAKRFDSPDLGQHARRIQAEAAPKAVVQ